MYKKTLFLVGLLVLISSVSKAQVSLVFHQSEIPFIGINKQIGGRFLPEFRIGTDNFFEDTSLELNLNYMFIKKSSYEFYSGIGGRIQFFEGLVVPVGVNYYPFDNKNFGFHVELAGLLGDDNVIRGSWGIRMKLDKSR